MPAQLSKTDAEWRVRLGRQPFRVTRRAGSSNHFASRRSPADDQIGEQGALPAV